MPTDPDTLSPTVAYIRARRAGLVPDLAPGITLPDTGLLTVEDALDGGPVLLATWQAWQAALRLDTAACNVDCAGIPGNAALILGELVHRLRMAVRLEEQEDPAIRAWWRANPLRKMYLGLE